MFITSEDTALEKVAKVRWAQQEFGRQIKDPQTTRQNRRDAQQGRGLCDGLLPAFLADAMLEMTGVKMEATE